MPLFRLRSLCVAVGALLAFGLAGCGRRETRVASGDRSQTLHYGNLGEPTDLDPALVVDNNTGFVVESLMEGLAQYDARTGLPDPAGAERWEVSADNLTWTFHLRPEARWSNGDPVTARDYVYAEKRILSPGLAAEYASLLFCLKNAEAYYTRQIGDFSQVGAHAMDDHTLVLQLGRPLPYLPALLCNTSWYPVHKGTIEKFGRMDERGTHWTRPGNYVGNGPFVLTEWEPHQIVRVTKSPNYWNRDHVLLHEIDFYPIEDLSTEEAMFRSGGLHITASIPQDKIPVYQRNPARSSLLHLEPQYATYYYVFNVNKPPLNDVRVRRALAYAIDRLEIVDRVALGNQPPAYNLTPPNPVGFTGTARIRHDPEQARKLLAEAGYPGGKGFPHIEVLYNTNEGHRKIAETIQQMWHRELGIDVGIYNQESKVWSDTLRQKDYQIARYGWFADYLDPSTFMDTMLSDNGNNYAGWKNAEYDRVVNEADHEPDQARRFALYQRGEQILADECPFAPIYFYTRANLRLPDVKGWYGNLLDQHPYTDVYLEAPAK
jgi:oligopeptide transport system substrate-binding protein